MRVYTIALFLLVLVVAAHAWPWGRDDDDDDADDSGGFFGNILSGMRKQGAKIGKALSKFGKKLSNAGKSIASGLGGWGEKFANGMSTFSDRLTSDINKAVKAAEAQNEKAQAVLNNPKNKKITEKTTKVVDGQEITKTETKIISPSGQVLENVVQIESQPVGSVKYDVKITSVKPETSSAKPPSKKPAKKPHRLKFIPSQGA